MSASFFIRFALTTHTWEPRYREVSRLDPAQVAAGIVRSRETPLMGGYVFVHEGLIWNHAHAGLRTAVGALYNPDDVRAGLDRVDDSLTLLRSVQLLFDQQSPVTAGLTEMSVMRLKRWGGHREVTITGLGHHNEYLYPTLKVELARWWDELLGASEDYLRFAHRIEQAIGERTPGVALETGSRHLAREAWESEVRGLRARLGEARSG